MIPEGRYLAKATEWDLGIADKGTEYIAVVFRIAEGQYAGQFRTWRGFFTEKTEKRTVESLRYCGWTGNDFTNLTDLDKNFVTVTIEHESNEETGKLYDKIAWVNKPGNLAVKTAMDEKHKAVFAKRMRGVCVSVPKTLAEPTEVVPTNNNTAQKTESDIVGDDFPF